LILFLTSGGCSALLPAPVPTVSLKDKQKLTGLLLRSGASIHEINTVRKHISGSKGGRLYRSADNPNQIIVQLDWESAEKVQQFASSPGLREAMERGGVVGVPQAFFLEEIEKLAG
jgi:glycerate-2-kinase